MFATTTMSTFLTTVTFVALIHLLYTKTYFIIFGELKQPAKNTQFISEIDIKKMYYDILLIISIIF